MNLSKYSSSQASPTFGSTKQVTISSFTLRLLWLLTMLLGTGVSSPAYGQSYPQSATDQVSQPDPGGSVADLQQQLSSLGYYNGPITGYFDSSTQAAVSRFQQDNGLVPDGIVGPATSNALGQSSVSTPTSSAESQPTAGSYMQLDDGGNQVSQLQQQLAQTGYYTGSITGIFDAQTQAAVMNFQRDRGLAVDGIVGRATEAALFQTPQQTATATSTTSTPVAASTAATGATVYTPSATPSDGLLQLGDMGTEVSDLQTKLQALGYYDGPISGSFGSQTQTALIAFQQAQGLTTDGIAGPRVNSALSTATLPTQTASTSTPSAALSQPTTVQPAVGTPPIIAPQVTETQAAPTAQPQVTTVQVPPVASSMPPVASPPSSSSAQPPLPNAAPSIQNVEGGRFSVVELQRRLQLRGFDPVEMTGVYDPATQTAITQAQQAYGLSQSDLFGP